VYRGQVESPIDNLAADLAVPQHQWFLDTFKEACNQNGITPDLTLSPSLASALNDWLSQRLSKKRYIGNRAFFEEKPHHFKDKINQIVAEWESLRTSGLGKRIGVPPVPDLEFLVSYREQLFTWITEQRMRTTEAVLERLQLGGQC
jgi:hypothetical protein